MKYKVAALVFLGFVISPLSAATGDAEAGKEKVATCVACHGNNGNSVNPTWPKLAGQHVDYTVKQLQAFKLSMQDQEKGRYDVAMSPMAMPLSDQDMLDVAAYYEQQEIKPGSVPKEYFELGQKLYRGGGAANGVTACIACHGPRGKGNGLAKFPSLAGQHAEYTIKQMQAFRDGKRHNSPNEMMGMIAKRMTDEQIKAVSHYVAGLH